MVQIQEECTHIHANTNTQPDTIWPLQQTRPSDETDQGTKGTEGLDTCATARKKQQYYYNAISISTYFLRKKFCRKKVSCRRVVKKQLSMKDV